MEAYQEVSPLWNLSDPITQLSDQDFFNLLQKQFHVSANGVNDFQTSPDGVNPQNLSMYSLPNLSPPSTSDESSPSPSNSNQDTSKDGVNDDPTLKRKANSDRLENEPNSKTQHMGDKQDTSRRKSSGYTPKDEHRLLKRKEQNRAAQRAFRERKEKHVKDLEDKVAELEAKNEATEHENENLRDMLGRLQSENVSLKQSAFTFSMQKDATGSPSNAAPKPRSMYSADDSMSSTKPINPLHWSSLTTFNPNMLNLLDDNFSQRTATDNAIQMDFGFNNPPQGLSSNAPFTTITSNPMFMSLVSTFDNLSPSNNTASSTASESHTSNRGNGNSENNVEGFNYAMHSLSPWPSSTPNVQDPIFDDLFSGYLDTLSGSDFSNLSGSSSSVSPVAHFASPTTLDAQPSPMANASSSSSPSVLRQDSSTSRCDPPQEIAHSLDRCPKTRSEVQDQITQEGDSIFAPPIQKSNDQAFGTMVKCSGSKLPKTEQSDQNVEVFAAWKTFTNDPDLKDVDLTNLCAEFTNKACCDGTKVVLKPAALDEIKENLTKTRKQ